MPFVRYSVMTPKAGQADRLRELIDQLLEFHRERDGFVSGYRLEPDEHDVHSFVGRFTVWQSEAHANATAMQQHDQTLQSEILLAAEADTHEERAFLAEAFELS